MLPSMRVMVRLAKKSPKNQSRILEPTSTSRSRLVMPARCRGVIEALHPSTKKMLKRLLPITLPMAISGFFLRAATMEVASSGMRYNAKTERTMKMSGVDWEQYFSKMKECREWMMEQPHEDVWIRSEDSLKLHGTYFRGSGNVEEKKCKKAVICFHGYTSQGLADYGSISNYYLKRGYNVLLVDQRSHGQSEGKYIGFGCKDRYDAYRWIEWVIGQEGENVQILLHGNSMGGATVLMASGLDLPQQVKGIIADCPFTSPKAVFTHVLHSMYHLPAFPIIQIADAVNKKQAGYGLDECNSAREVRKAKVPVLLIHGDADTFVPCSMSEEIYKNCKSPKQKLIIHGAGHCESYYKDREAYEGAMDSFIGGIIE